MTMEYGSQRPLDVSAQAAPPTSQSTAVFEKSTVKLAEDENAPDDADRGAGNLNEMSLQELSNIVATAETERERRQATAEKHKRFAFPFACLTLTAMTFIMAIRGRRFSTRPRTVIAILFLAMGFYLLLVVGQNLALSGRVPVWLGVWFSNILYGSIVARSLSSSKPPFSSGFLTSLIASRPSAEPGGKPAIADSEGSDRKAAGRSVHRSNRAGSFNLINYLLVSEIVKYLALAAASLVVTSTIFTLFDLVPAIIKNGIPVSYAASYLGYLSPQLAYYVAPFSLLVALLMSFSVLSRSNQLVIIAGAGQSRMRFVAAVLFTSVALGVSLWAMANYVMPYTNREQDERYNRIKGRQIEQTTIAFGRKWVFGKNNNIYSYQRIEPDNTLVNASVYSLSAQQGLLRSTMHFSAASQVNDTTWQFDNGWLENVKADSTVERRSVQGRPERVTVEEGSGIFRRTTNESTKMSDWDLRRYIDQLNSVGMSTVDLQIDLKKRIAFPFSCLTLAILAIPFITAKGGRRSGPMISVAISVGIGLVFWLLTTFFEAAGKQENLPKDIAVWGPHILFVAIGLYLNFFRYRLQ
jgi:LPS export ABC transporter permease LptG